MLTVPAIRKIRPTAERREIPDRDGLRLIVQPSGRMSWAVRLRRPDGRTAKITLGPLASVDAPVGSIPKIGSPLTLVEARVLAHQIAVDRASGRDPVLDHKLGKRNAKGSTTSAFPAGAERFVREYASRYQRRWRDTARHLGFIVGQDNELTVRKGGLADLWSGRPLKSLDVDAIADVIEDAQANGIPGLTTRKSGELESRELGLYRSLSKAFAWFTQKRLVQTNPMLGMSKPRQAPARDRVLTLDEIRLFWRATGEMGQPFGPLFRLLLVTGQRLNEVAGAAEQEISDDGANWSLPGSRTKNRRAHVVPLSAQARELFRSVERTSSPSRLIFSTNGKSPVSGFSKAKKTLDGIIMRLAKEADAEASLQPWRLHDLRRTVATFMAEKVNVPPHIIEAVLNHVSGAKASVAGVYNRAVYAEQKREAQENWAAWLTTQVKPRIVRKYLHGTIIRKRAIKRTV